MEMVPFTTPTPSFDSAAEESQFESILFSSIPLAYLIHQTLTIFAMRLPYIPDPPEFTEEADKAVLERIKERRGPKGLIALDRTLLHSPPVADGW
jgi:hypothetical protein